MTPIAPAGDRPSPRTRPKATIALMPEAGGQGDRVVGDQRPSRWSGRRQEGRGRGGRRNEGIPLGALREHVRQDERVQEDDVGHHQERGDAGPDLGADVRPPLGELEEGVEPAAAWADWWLAPWYLALPSLRGRPSAPCARAVPDTMLGYRCRGAAYSAREAAARMAIFRAATC